MKKLVIILVAILIVVVSTGVVVFGAVSENNESGFMNETLEPFHQQEISWEDDPWESFDTVVNKYGIHQNSKAQLDIPIYYENDLLFSANKNFTLGQDGSMFRHLNSLPNEASATLARYPTSALRVRSDGIVYAVYDTDTGFRLYLFFARLGYPSTTPETSTVAATIGFPIVIKNMLSYSDFADLKIGDNISKVEDVDEVATLYKKQLLDVWELDCKGAAALAKSGDPCKSIHYLSDGILKIEYEMLEDQTLVISNLIYYENYQMMDASGQAVNYKIEDVDLPIEQIN